VCPAKSKEADRPQGDQHGAQGTDPGERESQRPLLRDAAVNERSRVDFSTVRGVQFLEPLFEFSGACAGCGETPYVKLLSQLFGDRLMVANATGCSSIYGGNLPTTPWAVNSEGPRAGLVELAVRGQCRVRLRHPARRRHASHLAFMNCSRALRPNSAIGLGGQI
jgi:hypothetical protein